MRKVNMKKYNALNNSFQAIEKYKYGLSQKTIIKA